jgi:hypothetical protein
MIGIGEQLVACQTLRIMRNSSKFPLEMPSTVVDPLKNSLSVRGLAP